jgi:hypothetical protein
LDVNIGNSFPDIKTRVMAYTSDISRRRFYRKFMGTRLFYDFNMRETDYYGYWWTGVCFISWICEVTPFNIAFSQR